MKLTLNMIKEYIDLHHDINYIASKLTLSGIETEYDTFYDQFIIVEIIDIKKHPNADKLNICTIEYNGEYLDIICGADNVQIGMKTVFAPINTKFDSFTIEKRKLRGITSNGMLCSAEELKLEEQSSGILELSQDIKTNTTLSNIINLHIDFNITPDRGDLMSAYGIAREIAGLRMGKLKKMKINEYKYEQLDIDNFFIARIDNISLDTPEYIKQTLLSINVKLISGPVDIANYIMYSFGQPMHVYDADKIGDEISVGKYTGKFYALDNKEYQIEDAIIVKGKKLGAIAGIIGSKDTAIDENTRNIIVESAYFDKEIIARISSQTNLKTEASIRFSRGIDINNCFDALKIYLDYIQGNIKYIKGNYVLYKEKYILFDPKLTEEIAGENIDINILNNMSIMSTDYRLSIPTWRHDLNNEYDIVNELIRISNIEIKSQCLDIYDHIASYKPCNIHVILRAHGLNERITWSFTDKIEGIKIKSSNKYLRSSLIYNLLEDYSIHQKRKYYYHGIYEIGKVFFDNIEEERVAYIMKIEKTHKNILESKKIFDILTDYMNIEKKYLNDKSDIFDNDQVNMNNAYFGLVSKKILDIYDIQDDIVACEIPYKIYDKKYNHIQGKYYTSVIRDVTFIGNHKQSAHVIQEIIDNIEEIENIIIKDVYNNSITITIYIRSLSGTMDSNQIKYITHQIFDILTRNDFIIPGL